MLSAPKNVREIIGPKRLKAGETPLRTPVGAPRWSNKKENMFD